jgi:hypothetical protein
MPPTPQHAWLHQLLGDWTWTAEAAAPAEPLTGTESVYAVGQLWIQAHGDGAFGHTQVTLGYDSAQGRFVGTWIGAMSSHLWVYFDGHLAADDDTTTLTLESAGPAPDGSVARYREELVRLGPDERVTRSWIEGRDGVWTPILTLHYRRVTPAGSSGSTSP